MDVVGETSVEVEIDPSFRDIEGEFTEGAVIVFPAAMFLFEVAITKLLDGFGGGTLSVSCAPSIPIGCDVASPS